MAKNLCVVCGKDSSGFRVCVRCYHKSNRPCPGCGKPTPQLTVLGKPRKNPRCVACAASINAACRKVGHRCRVCKKRRRDVREQYQVCPDCLDIKTQCPVCKKPMPKYRKRGWLR